MLPTWKVSNFAPLDTAQTALETRSSRRLQNHYRQNQKLKLVCWAFLHFSRAIFNIQIPTISKFLLLERVRIVWINKHLASKEQIKLNNFQWKLSNILFTYNKRYQNNFIALLRRYTQQRRTKVLRFHWTRSNKVIKSRHHRRRKRSQ